MKLQRIVREGNEIILEVTGVLCTTKEELVQSRAFRDFTMSFVDHLRESNSVFLDLTGIDLRLDQSAEFLVETFARLVSSPIERVAEETPSARVFLETRNALHRLTDAFYDYWRSFERYLVCRPDESLQACEDKESVFIEGVVLLADSVRGAYRAVCENIIGKRPIVFRQVQAGCNVGLIVDKHPWDLPKGYPPQLADIPFIEHQLINPPLIMDPPTNKRRGHFIKLDENPLEVLDIDPGQYLCAPVQVGPIVEFVYFHRKMMGLGCALGNLFELASLEQIERGPDAVYIYGADGDALARYGEHPLVFYDDEKNDIFVAAVPRDDTYAYFGYLKKMILTLHNAVVMKRGRMPFHGAMTKLTLSNGQNANILIIGETATGKSESLEALRLLSKDFLRDIVVVADDMGSLEVDQSGRILGYGTETGAFIRLDDLQQGYAFGQIDRAIIMSPQKTNARVVLPVTTLADVLRGYPVDFILYANNYEAVDEEHPIIEALHDTRSALEVFSQGAAMSRGTTASTGLVHSYFANIFGPPAYKERHQDLATSVFEAAMRGGVFVGQLRTRLGIEGYGQRGPQEAAAALIELIKDRTLR